MYLSTSAVLDPNPGTRLPVNQRKVEVTKHYNVTRRGGHLTYARTDFIHNFFKGFSRRIGGGGGLYVLISTN